MPAILLGVEAVPLLVHLRLRHGHAAAAQGCAASSAATRTQWKRRCSLHGWLLRHMKLTKRLRPLLPRLLGVEESRAPTTRCPQDSHWLSILVNFMRVP